MPTHPLGPQPIMETLVLRAAVSTWFQTGRDTQFGGHGAAVNDVGSATF